MFHFERVAFYFLMLDILLNKGNKNFQEHSDMTELQPAISRGMPEQGYRFLAGRGASSCRVSQGAETKKNLSSSCISGRKFMCNY
jgi:hypothetical protein